MKDDEPILVAAAKAGDISAFETLVGRYERKIFRLTQNITQNREDAEDAMQEAFLKAFEHLAEFEGNSRFYTWLVRIAVNQALMKLRKRRPNVVSLDEEVDTGEDMMPREVEDWGPSPEERYEQTELSGDSFESYRGTRPTFPNRFPIAGHRRIVDRRDGGSAGAFRARGEIAAFAGAAEVAAEAESIFSAGRKSVKCKDIISELADYLDEALDPILRASIEEHLGKCKDCRVVVDTTKQTIEIFCNSEPAPLPADTR